MKTRGEATVRGCEKRIFYIKNTGSELFEEAYLVLKRQDKAVSPGTGARGSRELEFEANKIVSAMWSGTLETPRKDSGKDRLRAFVAGAAASSVFTALVISGVYMLIVS